MQKLGQNTHTFLSLFSCTDFYLKDLYIIKCYKLFGVFVEHSSKICYSFSVVTPVEIRNLQFGFKSCRHFTTHLKKTQSSVLFLNIRFITCFFFFGCLMTFFVILQFDTIEQIYSVLLREFVCANQKHMDE